MMSTESTPTPQTDMIADYMHLKHNIDKLEVPENTQRIIGHLLITGRDALVTGDASDMRWAELLRIAAHSSDSGNPSNIIASLETYLSEQKISIPEQTSR